MVGPTEGADATGAVLKVANALATCARACRRRRVFTHEVDGKTRVVCDFNPAIWEHVEEIDEAMLEDALLPSTRSLPFNLVIDTLT